MDTWTINGKVFTEEALLGRGKDGYSHLVRDEQGNHFVLKSMHELYTKEVSAWDKLRYNLECYDILKDLDIVIPKLLDVDASSPVMLKEYIPGPTAAQLLKCGSLPDSAWSKMEILAEAAKKAGLNLDYTPSNYILDEEGRIIYIDYECYPYAEVSDFEHCGKYDWEILRPVSADDQTL